MSVMREDDDEKNGEILTIEENDEEPKKPAPKQEEGEAEDDGDERLSAEQRQDDDDADTGTDEEREAKRHRRRAERAEKKRIRYAERMELDALRQQHAKLQEEMAVLRNGQMGQSAHMIDERLNQAVYRARQAEEALAKAIETGNGEIARDALRLRDRAMNEAQQLDMQRRALAQRSQAPAEPQMDPLVQRRAGEFIDRHKGWYDQRGENEDSAIMLAIDDRLAKEGYDPASPDYWEELEKRAAKRLPHRFKSAQEQEPAPRRTGGPPVGGRSSSAPGPNQVYVSAERKAAMMEAGVWDDPKLRKDALRRYAEFDRTNSVR